MHGYDKARSAFRCSMRERLLFRNARATRSKNRALPSVMRDAGWVASVYVHQLSKHARKPNDASNGTAHFDKKNGPEKPDE